jgi:hypothetical protein
MVQKYGVTLTHLRRLQSNDLVLDQIYHNLEIEKLHIKFSKYILGVNKRASNFATLSELRRFPLHFDIIKSMIRYWYRLENLDSNFTSLKDAYEESKKLFEIKIPSWYGSITLLIKNIRGLKELSNVIICPNINSNLLIQMSYIKSIKRIGENKC